MKKLFMLASFAALMFSCKENVTEVPFEEKMPINISVDVQTRANDSTFESGDAVGIYVVNYNGSAAGTLAAEGNQADNAKFEYNGGGWSSEAPIYWKDKSTSADFYAYYPYSESVNIAAQPFSVQADQSNDANFWASDFLWGKTAKVAPTSNAVGVQVNHVMSRMLIEVKPGNGFTTEAWNNAQKSVTIANVFTDATINLATGVATATGSSTTIIPRGVDSINITTLNYKAMMVPQTVADNTKLIVINVDGTEYVYRTGHTFKANTQHKFSVTVNKTGSSVDVTIGEWEMDGSVNQGAAVEEESEVTEFNPNHCIYYKKNTVKDLSGDDYIVDESYFKGASGAVVEMKFKMNGDMQGSSKGYLCSSSNQASDYASELYIDNTELYYSSDTKEGPWQYFSYKWTDIGVNCTDLITLRFSTVDKTLTINDKVFQNDKINNTSWSYFFSSYYRERDEGLMQTMEGVPEGSELYYAKVYDTEGKLIYFGYAAKAINPATGNMEYCWYSDNNGVKSYEFAYNAAEMGGFGGNF
jgi:hypothetical protein